MLYRLARPALFALDPERAHGLAIAALKALPGRPARLGGPLETTVAGLTFPNPLGMAAGFDKDGEAPDALLGRGFGFVEVGSITPRPQAAASLKSIRGVSVDVVSPGEYGKADRAGY